jgi:hypothetical protein
VQSFARLLLDVGRTCPLFLGFLQRIDLQLLTRDAAVQRGNLRPLTEQLTCRRRERERERGDDHREHRSPSGEHGLAMTVPITYLRVNVLADARRSTVVCSRTAATHRQPTTNRGNADAPA